MDINDIITEELRTLLKEGYVMEDDRFKFRQIVQNTNFYNFQSFSNDFDVDVTESEIAVNWRIAFWLNDQGVENFLVQADSVEGTYHVELLNKQSDEVEQEMDKNITETPWRFQVNPTTLKMGDGLYIESVDFDFQTKNCTVNFFETEL